MDRRHCMYEKAEKSTDRCKRHIWSMSCTTGDWSYWECIWGGLNYTKLKKNKKLTVWPGMSFISGFSNTITRREVGSGSHMKRKEYQCRIRPVKSIECKEVHHQEGRWSLDLLRSLSEGVNELQAPLLCIREGHCPVVIMMTAILSDSSYWTSVVHPQATTRGF